MEQLDYNILFRWFVGLELDEPIWAVTVFTKNRERLLNQAVAQRFFQLVVERATPRLSDEHFTVDGTLIEAWAGHKSFQRKDDDPDDQGRNFHGQTRTNDTHASTTDPDARLYRKSKGTEARLAYLGHVLMDNAHGLVVQAQATIATGTAERATALDLLRGHGAGPGCTVGADKQYDTRAFVAEVRALGVTPHVRPHGRRRGGSAIDGRTTRHASYGRSQSCRPRIERVFAWVKPIAGLRKVKLRGLADVQWLFVFACAAFNLKRVARLRGGVMRR